MLKPPQATSGCRVMAMLALAGAVIAGIGGCQALPTATAVSLPNPAIVPPIDRDLMWDQLVDVVDDHFEIEREQRVRLEGDVLSIGRIDTLPLQGATYLEPWKGDSIGGYERLESTLQSIRRRALVHVIPLEQGYQVEMIVYKELEDVVRPDFATAGRATFRHDTSQRGVTPLVGEQPPTVGWISQGRDMLLEQQMLANLLSRTGGVP